MPHLPDPEGTGVTYLEEWPYPIKIYTLGRFEILRDDSRLHFSGKEQKKPLELLKALIAFGGRDVPEERLTDALWPDADGDLAHKSFETTLGRLRRLLGGDEFIRHRARQLTLNPLYCWVDSLALEHIILDMIRETADDRAATCSAKKPWTCTKVLFFQRTPGGMGNPLSRNPEKQAAPRHLAGRAAITSSRASGKGPPSIIRKGSRRTALPRNSTGGSWSVICNLGNNADAVKTYNRCRRLLQAELGIEPSAETTAVFSSITQ